MLIAIIADCYPPMQSSAALMIKDLAIELVIQGHNPIVIIPDSTIDAPIIRSVDKGIQVLRIKAFQTKDVGYMRRALSEFYMPYKMLRSLKKSHFFDLSLDAVIWYSPSIFHGPLVKALKKSNGCKSYLILRDIFPEWAVNLGIIRRGLSYQIFKLIEAYQYSVADTIGIQSPANYKHIEKWDIPNQRSIEVLQNWLGNTTNIDCNISVQNSVLTDRTIFVYAGNMGISQGIGGFLDVVERLDGIRNDIGFIFVGRGSDMLNFYGEVAKRHLSNILFFDEIPQQELGRLYDQCHFGLVFLDARHLTHNIPGKFISYMKNGLPVLACINDGNDLFEIIKSKKVGKAFVGIDIDEIVPDIELMVDQLENDKEITLRCKALASELFSSKRAVKQIVNTFK